MSVLCTRVKSPGHKDWGKLVLMMKFSHATQNDILTLDAGKGDIHNVEWLTDSAFRVHPDFESPMGTTMTVKGKKDLAINVSAKQKLNTESSSIAELVGVDCALPLALWVPPFLEAQGCEVKENAIFQDNKSATLLAKNRKTSSGKQTRAINIRHFHIKDQIKRGNVSAEYCNTDNVTSDCVSEGLQGLKF